MKSIKQFSVKLAGLVLIFVIPGFTCSTKDRPQTDQSIQELFWVTNKGSQMPVLIIGNKESASILVMIHGGPGEGMIGITGWYTGYPTSNLTDNFLLALWDQRYAGYSKNPDPIDWSPVNVVQYAEDCNMVANQLKNLFPGKKIIVIGHSWGGAVLVKFITNSDYRYSYDGWVVTDGMVNGYELANAYLSYGRRRCIDLINAGETRYTDTLAYLNSLTFNPLVYDKTHFLSVMQAARSLVIPGEPQVSSEDICHLTQVEKSIFPDTADQIRRNKNWGSEANSDLFVNQAYHINSSADYGNISKPGLIIWGENDYKTPLEGSYPFTASLDSSGVPFEFKMYTNCWHFPMITNREQYYQDIKNYVDGL